jgi:hypothetical protein
MAFVSCRKTTVELHVMSGESDRKIQIASVVPEKKEDFDIEISNGARQTADQKSRKVNYIQYFLVFLGCAAGIVVSQLIIEQMRKTSGPTQNPPERPPYQVERMPSAIKMANPHLAWAEAECNRAIDHNIQNLMDLFTESKKHTRRYTEYALGWNSKWLLIRDNIPFTVKQHGPYLRSEFERQVLSTKSIDEAVRLSVELQIKTIQDVENQLLVMLKKDSVGYPDLKSFQKHDLDTIVVLFGAAVDKASGSAASETVADVGKLVASQVVSGVAASVAIAIGAKMVSTGVIAGVSVPSSAFTFGASLVVGVVIDQFVSWVWDWYADPKGNLANKLNQTLDQMSEAAIEGSDGKPGLRKRLMELNSNRARLRRTATLEMLTQ